MAGGVTFNLVAEQVDDLLTATAGGGQANALQLKKQLNRLSTVATSGDSAQLPPSAPGLSIIVINSGAKPAQIFGNGTDTINGVAAATGVSQMQSSLVIYACLTAGSWFAVGLGEGFSGSLTTYSTTDNLTAHAGGGQASGTPITASINRFTTVATAADSGLLPASASGMEITVVNAAAVNAMNVFPATGEQINALGANTAFSLAAGKTMSLYCATAGQWHAILSA